MIMDEHPTNSWPYVAAQWVNSVPLLQQLRLRVVVYQPHTWDHSQCRAFAISDAADWDCYLRKIALHPPPPRQYGAANSANEVPDPVLLFSQCAPYGASPAVLPRAAAWIADGREIFWL